MYIWSASGTEAAYTNWGPRQPVGEADPSQDCVMASRGDTCAEAGWWVTHCYT